MLTTYLYPPFFIKMLFLVVKIHIILKLYVALPFTFLYLKHECGNQIVKLNVTFLVRLFVKKPCFL